VRPEWMIQVRNLKLAEDHWSVAKPIFQIIEQSLQETGLKHVPIVCILCVTHFFTGRNFLLWTKFKVDLSEAFVVSALVEWLIRTFALSVKDVWSSI